MNDWYTADATWALWVKNREEYVQKFVYEGRFHADVHEDVVNNFKIVSHIMASAWHHYPMYDEALRKLLNTIEMAIKLRSEAAGIRVTKHTNLQSLIDKLYPVEKAKRFNTQLHSIRLIRNRYAHPEHYHFGGIAIRPIILPLLNAINKLFLSEETITAGEAHMTALVKDVAVLQASVLILEWQQKRYLVREAKPLAAHLVNGKWSSFWIFHPILNDLSKSMVEKDYPPPIMLGLIDVMTTQTGIEAIEWVTKQQVRIMPTTDSRNLVKLEKYNQAWLLAPEAERMLFEWQQRESITAVFDEFQYKFFGSAT